MTISDSDRERFQQIGRDRIASALGEGKFQSTGLTENLKAAAIEWVKEQDAERDRSSALETSVQQETLRWAKIAGLAAIVGVSVAIAGLFVSILALIISFIAR
jgi:hypothetical protein